MKQYLIIGLLLITLLPEAAKAQWTFDIVSVEAYINDHAVRWNTATSCCMNTAGTR